MVRSLEEIPNLLKVIIYSILSLNIRNYMISFFYMFLICSATLFSEEGMGWESISCWLLDIVFLERKFCLPFHGFLPWISIRLGGQVDSLLIVFWPQEIGLFSWLNNQVYFFLRDCLKATNPACPVRPWHQSSVISSSHAMIELQLWKCGPGMTTGRDRWFYRSHSHL